MRTLLLMAAVALFCLVCSSDAQRSPKQQKLPALPKTSPPPFALGAGQVLEQLGAWDKAEKEYLSVDNVASPTDRKTTLDGLARVEEKAKAERRDNSLSAARILASTEHWKEAEEVYIDLLKSDAAARAIAAENLEQIQPRWSNTRWPERFDEAVLNAGRILLALLIVAAVAYFVHTIRKMREIIQFQPFRANTDDSGKQIDFWIQHVFADLRSPTPTFSLSPNLASSLPLMALPSLSDQIPELDLEVGGTKIPFQAIYEVFAKPRARVSGTWYSGVSGAARATVEKRQGLNYIPFAFTARPISSAVGAPQDNDLQLFAYAVFIEAAKT